MAIRLDVAAAKDLPQMVELLGTLFAQEAEFLPDASKQDRVRRIVHAPGNALSGSADDGITR